MSVRNTVPSFPKPSCRTIRSRGRSAYAEARFSMSSEGSDTIVPSRESRGYSADVRIRLHVNGQTYRVAQIGGGRLIFDSPLTFPAATGTVVITVDGQQHHWQA